MAKKIGFLVNSDRCIGCHACELACKNEYQQEPDIRWRKVYPLKENSFGGFAREFASLACNHCVDPACLKACPAMAYVKREDGIVMHKKERCIGCKNCMLACPYKVPEFNKKTKKVEKCHMCAMRQERGEKPACVAGCPMEAISVVDITDDIAGAERSLPGFPNVAITNPTTRFIKPVVGQQVRRDA